MPFFGQLYYRERRDCVIDGTQADKKGGLRKSEALLSPNEKQVFSDHVFDQPALHATRFLTRHGKFDIG